MSEYCFNVSRERDPCDPDTVGARPGESILDNSTVGVAFFAAGRSVLDELGDPDPP